MVIRLRRRYRVTALVDRQLLVDEALGASVGGTFIGRTAFGSVRDARTAWSATPTRALELFCHRGHLPQNIRDRLHAALVQTPETGGVVVRKLAGQDLPQELAEVIPFRLRPCVGGL